MSRPTSRRRGPARVLLAAIVPVIALALAVPPSEAAVTNCVTSSPTGAYTVKVCLTAPAPSATLSGAVSAMASVTVTGTSPGVAKAYWQLDGGLLLTDYASPYSFTLYTDDFADGTYTISVRAILRDGNASAPVTATVHFANGNATTPVNTNTWTPPAPQQVPWGTPMTVAAVGDGAGGEPNTATVNSLVTSWNPDLLLYLGDVYEDGTLTEFRNWFGTSGSWYDQYRSIMLPVIGNHEYDGGGYWSYWDNIPHYYSFDANGWHFIGLDTTSQYNQSAPGTAQYDWLAADLAANDSPCTIVFGHHPLYNVGKEGPTTRLQAMWELMAQHKVTMFLVGHDHTYQRWHPLSGAGVKNTTGVIEVIAGTGGHSSQSPLTSDSRVAVKLKTYGAFRMDLRGSDMDFKFFNPTGSVLDQGSIPCKGDDGIAPTAPANVDATASFGNVHLSWSAASDNLGVTSYAVYRDGTQIGTTTDLAFVDTSAPAAATVSYEIGARDAAGNETRSAPRLVNTGGADTTPPSVPLGVNAALYSDRTVRVSWSPSTDDVGVAWYVVYRDGVPIGTADATPDPQFEDLLPPGVDEAGYRVAARDLAGNESALSDEVRIASADHTPPGTPPGLTGTATGANSVHLEWSAATDNVGVTAYRVYRNGNQIGMVDAAVRSFDYAQVLSGTTADYQVRAQDAAGNMSSVPATVTVTQPEPTPLNAVADSWVNSASPTTNAGTSSVMRSDADPVQRPYLRFNLSGIQGQVVRARLLVYANTRSTTPVSVRTSGTGWSESTLTWNNAPAPGAVVATAPAWAGPGWITVDVTSVVTTGGSVGFVLDTASTTSATYGTKESALPARLLLDVYP